MSEAVSDIVALECDGIGVIRRVIRDDLGMFDGPSPPTSLPAMSEPGSMKQAFGLLEAARSKEAVFDWPLTVRTPAGPRALVFAAASGEEYLAVVGSGSREHFERVVEDLMSINNAHVNALRAALKARATSSDDAIYGELMRLNNEMAAMQRQLAKKNHELVQLNQQKNHLLGMAAHDLRNPLGVIRGYARILLQISEPTDEQHQMLSAICKSSEFMVNLLDDLLDVSAIESGELVLHLAPSDLGELVTSAVTVARTAGQLKDIEVDLARCDALPPLDIDPVKTRQVLDNLLSNAIKYSHPGTSVRVEVHAEDMARMVVADQGQGIPEDELAGIFEPFGTSSVMATAGERSTGLGLAIVRRIVEGHGGTIGVESVVGEGSTFTVRLPRVSETSA